MQQFVSEIELLLIDEVHLLNEERGAVLEAVVSRMKTVCAESVGNTHWVVTEKTR